MVRIEGVGDVDITVQTKDGTLTITLRNTAYVSQFHMNVISLNKLIEKGVHWNTQNCELTFCGTFYCRIEKHYGHWVLEYNDLHLQDSAFAMKSTIPPTATASEDLWHHRMEHLHLDAVRKLPNIAQEIKIDGKIIRPEGSICSGCQEASARQQISRVPSQRATKPFEHVYFDLMPLAPAYNGDQWVLHSQADFSNITC